VDGRGRGEGKLGIPFKHEKEKDLTLGGTRNKLRTKYGVGGARRR